MKKHKAVLIFIFFMALSCQTKTIFRPEPFFIPLPDTKQEIINLESYQTQSESILSNKDKFFYTTWVDKKYGQHYIINKTYHDREMEIIKLKNQYIKELETRIIKNNEQIESRK